MLPGCRKLSTSVSLLRPVENCAIRQRGSGTLIYNNTACLHRTVYCTVYRHSEINICAPMLRKNTHKLKQKRYEILSAQINTNIHFNSFTRNIVRTDIWPQLFGLEATQAQLLQCPDKIFGYKQFYYFCKNRENLLQTDKLFCVKILTA